MFKRHFKGPLDIMVLKFGKVKKDIKVDYNDFKFEAMYMLQIMAMGLNGWKANF